MSYDLSMRMPDIRIPVDIAGSNEYLQWIATPTASVWFLLHSSAVRREFVYHEFGTYLYHKYYRNGMVVSFLTQKDIKERLSFSSKGHVSDLIKVLRHQKIIKEHRDKFEGNSIKLYQTAEVLDVENQLESVFLINVLRRQIAATQLAKFSKKERCKNGRKS